MNVPAHNPSTAPPKTAGQPVSPPAAPIPLPRASDTHPKRHALGAYRVRPLDF
jgi:hypothetical protein